MSTSNSKFFNAIKPIAKFFGPLAMRYWAAWSNLRFRRAVRKDPNLLPEEDRHISSLYDIQDLLYKLFSKYKWTADGIDQLGDAICPPPENYKRWLEGGLKDDCDGFHSLLHYCLSCNNIECYLLSVSTLGSGHCVLLLHFKGRWRVIDYTAVYPHFQSAQSAIDNYAAIYPQKYGSKYPVWYAGLVNYNYNTGKFYYAGIKQAKSKNKNKDEKFNGVS